MAPTQNPSLFERETNEEGSALYFGQYSGKGYGPMRRFVNFSLDHYPDKKCLGITTYNGSISMPVELRDVHEDAIRSIVMKKLYLQKKSSEGTLTYAERITLEKLNLEKLVESGMLDANDEILRMIRECSKKKN